MNDELKRFVNAVTETLRSTNELLKTMVGRIKDLEERTTCLETELEIKKVLYPQETGGARCVSQ